MASFYFSLFGLAVAVVTQGYEIAQIISLFVEVVFIRDVAETSKRLNVVNVVVFIGFFFTAILASVVIPLKGFLALNKPVWAIVINCPALPGCGVFTNEVKSLPFTMTPIRAKLAPIFSQPARGNFEYLSALLARYINLIRHTLSSTSLGAIFAGSLFGLVAPDSKFFAATITDANRKPIFITAILRAIFAAPVLKCALGNRESTTAILANTLNAIQLRGVVTPRRAILAASPLNFAQVGLKGITAVFANPFYFSRHKEPPASSIGVSCLGKPNTNRGQNHYATLLANCQLSFPKPFQYITERVFSQ